MVQSAIESAIMSNENKIGQRYSDKPTYGLEHLATFKIKHFSEIQNPKEKLKALMELDRSGSILIQKMYMSFSGSFLVMLDAEMNEIESFSGTLIQEPTAFISKDPIEKFNNILIFTVPGSSKGNTEMHVFQVLNVSAVHMVEDLRELSNGNIVTVDRNVVSINAKQQGTFQNCLAFNELITNPKIIDEQTKRGRDIIVLNHCFEDIERFLGRLQFAAEAMGKLNYRPHDDSLLILRSRPPLESEFVDIFAKYKLGFNYISKLQDHFKNIKEPIHNMFTSLQTVVETCNDVHENTNLAAQVVNPLLGRETINLLSSYVNHHEMEFWQSLGKNWTLPKDQFKDHKGSYHPIFHDDWSPDWSVDEEVAYLPPAIKKITKLFYKDSFTHSPDPSNTTWLSLLQSRNVKIAEAKYAKVADSERELSVSKGEYLEVIDDTRNWWRVRNSNGQIGYVPHTIISAFNFEQVSNYSGMDTDSLSSSIAEHGNNSHVNERESHAPAVPRSISMPNVPTPPPLPPLLSESSSMAPTNTIKRNMAAAGVMAAMRARNDSDDESVIAQQKINEELKHSIMMRERRKDLEILKTPQIYIQQSSSPQEVEEWLRGKGFSNEILKKLCGLSGEQLFALSNETIEGYFSPSESRRLISQIILQKSFSGYKTTRSVELRTKLAKARQKTGDVAKTDEVF